LTQREGETWSNDNCRLHSRINRWGRVFYVDVRLLIKISKVKTGIETHFYIKLREDDYSLLKKVRNYFNVEGSTIRRKKTKSFSLLSVWN